MESALIETDLAERARAILSEAIVVDACGGIRPETPQLDILADAGVTCLLQTVTHPGTGLRESLADIGKFRTFLDANSDRVLTVMSSSDIVEAKRDSRTAIVIAAQHSEFLGNDLSLLDPYRRLGMLVIQLTYQTANWVGDGCGEPHPGGLSQFGRELVAEMNNQRILVDLSHCSEPTTADAIEVSTQPVVFTHANASALTKHARTKSDDVLRSLAAKGGVVGLTALSVQNLSTPGVRPGLDEFRRHLEHLLEVVGPNHVGLGLDFHEWRTPEFHKEWHKIHPELAGFSFEDRRIKGLTNWSEIQSVVQVMLTMGLERQVMDQILGGNFLRVFAEVWDGK